MPSTTTANLIIPEVIGQMVDTNLGDRLTFAALADIDTTLQGQPGDTITFPRFSYIGPAQIVAEDDPIPVTQLSSATAQVPVKKYGKGVVVTDEARLSGYGDPVGEAARQLAHSIDHAIDDAFAAVLNSAPLSRVYPSPGPLSSATVSAALALFGDQQDGPLVLVTDPAGLVELRADPNYIRASDLGQRMINSGVVGEIWGAQIIISTKVKNDPATGQFNYYLVKPGALRLIRKQSTIIETEREAKYARDQIFATQHAAAYLYNPDALVVIAKFSGLQVLPDTVGITTEPAASGKFTLHIPANMQAPSGTEWHYVLDDNPTTPAVFGTALSGSTKWAGPTTAITSNGKLSCHVILVQSADKMPLKSFTALVP